MQAVSKALEFLSSDEAHDLFTRTFNPAAAFVQRREAVVSKRRLAAAKLLEAAAQQTQDPRLSALAVRARIDAFEEVKTTIQDMISKLQKEKEDDAKHKDYCVDEFNTNEVDTANKNREKETIAAKIEDLAETMDSLAKAIETLKGEVAELEADAMRAEEEAQEDFEEFTKDTTDSIAAKSKDIVDKSENLAQAEKDKIQKEE